MRDFRDLEVWQKGYRFARGVYRATRAFPRHELFGVTASTPRGRPVRAEPCYRLPSALMLAGLLPGLAACRPARDSSPPAPHDTSPPPVYLFEDVQVELSEAMPSVATLRWRTVEPAVCQVTFGVAESAALATSPEVVASTEQEAVLVGVPEEREVTWRIAAEAASGG